MWWIDESIYYKLEVSPIFSHLRLFTGISKLVGAEHRDSLRRGHSGSIESHRGEHSY